MFGACRTAAWVSLRAKRRGDFRYWHKADIEIAPRNVRFRGKSGHHELTASPREATELINIKSAEWPRAANRPHAHA
jgi:hypothetical protein